jgi:hypothetical protein
MRSDGTNGLLFPKIKREWMSFTRDSGGSINDNAPLGVAITPHVDSVEAKRPRRRHKDFGDTIGGRPTHTAIIGIPKSEKRIKKLRNRYQKILWKLSYTEARAICRALNYSKSTFIARKYGHRPPRLEEVIAVINWFNAGKPMTKNKHVLTEAVLFGTPKGFC